MNERIKELAEQAGWKEMSAELWGAHNDGCMSIYALKRFAELIMQDEREACAKLCEDRGKQKVQDWAHDEEMCDDAKARAWDAMVCASAIRARGEK